MKPDRYPVTDTERVALGMLASACANAAQRLNSSLLTVTMSALHALAEGRVERARRRDGRADRGGTMTPDRPALPAVQSATVDAATTADALERLVSAEVLPASFVDDEARAFWCRGCAGHGRLIATSTYDGGECPTCRGEDARPQTIPDLVAWASLGAATILRAEELARDTARRLAPWGVALRPRRVVWRVAVPGQRTPAGWPRRAYLPTDVATGAYRKTHTRRLRAGEPQLVAWSNAHVEVWPYTLPPCPWSPLAELLAMGLTLDTIADDALVVVVPPLGDTP